MIKAALPYLIKSKRSVFVFLHEKVVERLRKNVDSRHYGTSRVFSNALLYGQQEEICRNSSTQ